MATEMEYQKKPRNKAVPAVYLIMQRRDGRILLMLRDGTGYQDGNYDVPSGHVEEGEMPDEATCREAVEELGVKVETKDVKLVHVSYRPKHDQTGDRVDFFFFTSQWKKTPMIMEKDKCKKIIWRYASDIGLTNSLPVNTVPHVKHGIMEWINKRPFSFLGLEWLKEHNLYKL